MPQTVVQIAERIRVKDNQSAAVLKMRDHRGREIITGRNLLTYINHLYDTDGEEWPARLLKDWYAARSQQRRRAGGGEGTA